MSQAQFVGALGDIFEHSPWVAEAVWNKRPFASIESLHESMVRTVQEASEESRLKLIREHPDLATRLQIGEYSTKEQQGAGLDRLSTGEFEQFAEANRNYTERFGFPFIVAVRGKNKDDILAALQARIGNSAQEEAEEAMWQIARITAFRLHDLIIE
ncbi:2-oxo-4-hydroxy-4-carboxy-5-ureidoimidazoline decarboxylase [Paenibacillus sp. NEAU-GSW1]|uniref:2-oxo-4-hydroxy-4-carboxy-5-ureidoimidazoline decarboxylase n=1 Tax=Paenibacillus sp. NEAU-GSW1 TaxID=2682486 RepID=UPI0020A6745C|nr:2-oxo-4-hydroxy-4-carboxy-5-ureidoimidazoline decarboxylase [Paenibacillus sp. NEAU-GSW1]